MTVRTSVSGTDSQEAYAREMVARGKYPSLSAVLRHGLDVMRSETEIEDAEVAALRALLRERRRGEFVAVAQGSKRTRRMIAGKKAGDVA